MRMPVGPLFALATAAVVASTPVGAADAGFDAAAEWSRFLATGRLEDYAAQNVAGDLLQDDGVEADACRR